MSWEHREQRRVLAVIPVLIFGELSHAKGHTVNLSNDGCVIAAAYAPENGQYMHLLIQDSTRDTTINVRLAIVRWNALGLFGVEFIPAGSPLQKGLQDYSYMIDLCPSLGKLAHAGAPA